MGNTSLLLLLLIPLVGAVIGAFMKSVASARTWALLVCLATFGVAVSLYPKFDFSQVALPSSAGAMAKSVQVEFGSAGSSDPRLDDQAIGLKSIGFYFHLGMDTISYWLVLLTVFLQPLAILASFKSIQDRASEYYAWMLLLLCAMIGCFVARDLLLFYIFFELTLIPMFFIIGIWGGPEKRYAAGKFFLFTFAGSVFTLAGVLYLGWKADGFDLIKVTQVAQQVLTPGERFWVFLAFLAGFSVKVPLFPVHTWLPLAHTEAPTAGSVILAGVLLKLGTYGLLRFALPMGLPDVSIEFSRFLGALCIVGIIYGALVAWVQQDIKKLVAYSSVSHLGFCVLGMLAFNVIGMQGSILYMINHGLSTGALFLVIGMIYDRLHTRDIDELSGLARRMPRLAFFFILFTMSSIGLPGTNGFVSEFLTILGAFTSKNLGIAFGVLAATGVVLGAIYMLHMAARVIWGPLKYPGHGGDHGHAGQQSHGHEELTDITAREIAILVPIAAAVIWLGVLPTGVMNSMLAPIEQIRVPMAVESRPVAATADLQPNTDAAIPSSPGSL